MCPDVASTSSESNQRALIGVAQNLMTAFRFQCFVEARVWSRSVRSHTAMRPGRLSDVFAVPGYLMAALNHLGKAENVPKGGQSRLTVNLRKSHNGSGIRRMGKKSARNAQAGITQNGRCLHGADSMRHVSARANNSPSMAAAMRSSNTILGAWEMRFRLPGDWPRPTSADPCPWAKR